MDPNNKREKINKTIHTTMITIKINEPQRKLPKPKCLSRTLIRNLVNFIFFWKIGKFIFIKLYKIYIIKLSKQKYFVLN